MLKNFLRTSLFLQIFVSVALADIAATAAYQELSVEPRKETFEYNEYYVFEETNGSSVQLTAFKHVAEKFPLPLRPYNRDEHFGDWIRPSRASCLNTRGQVLRRDSKSNVTVNDRCTVVSGDWFDNYTNRDYNDADDIQIDHIVALKNAYMTGGHTWTKAKRCLYANYLGNKFHLLSVNGHENMRKSDKSPYEYVPPNKAYLCEYLRNWLAVKYIWKLKMTPREVKAIKDEVLENQCDSSLFTVSAAEITAQHEFMEKNKNLCR